MMLQIIIEFGRIYFPMSDVKTVEGCQQGITYTCQ